MALRLLLTDEMLDRFFSKLTKQTTQNTQIVFRVNMSATSFFDKR